MVETNSPRSLEVLLDISELLRPNQRLEVIASWEECIVSR